jgi:hypothetical protein
LSVSLVFFRAPYLYASNTFFTNRCLTMFYHPDIRSYSFDIFKTNNASLSPEMVLLGKST